MKKQKGTTITELLVFIIIVFGVASWVGNMYKLTGCDFEADYKCEVIHGVGVVPWVHMATVWAGTDADK